MLREMCNYDYSSLGYGDDGDIGVGVDSRKLHKDDREDRDNKDGNNFTNNSGSSINNDGSNIDRDCNSEKNYNEHKKINNQHRLLINNNNNNEIVTSDKNVWPKEYKEKYPNSFSYHFNTTLIRQYRLTVRDRTFIGSRIGQCLIVGAISGG